MPLQKVSRQEVIGRLLSVFRLHGYEGATLAMIAEEVGLQKASLYHLFPGGKEEMAKAVLESVGAFTEERILTPLRGEGSPTARLVAMVRQVRGFYGEGRFFCLFETLSLGGANAFSTAISEAMHAWIDALSSLAREEGASAREARQRAERVVVSIQGALVVARCLNDPKAFTRCLDAIPSIILPRED